MSKQVFLSSIRCILQLFKTLCYLALNAYKGKCFTLKQCSQHLKLGLKNKFIDQENYHFQLVICCCFVLFHSDFCLKDKQTQLVLGNILHYRYLRGHAAPCCSPFLLLLLNIYFFQEQTQNENVIVTMATILITLPF